MKIAPPFELLLLFVNVEDTIVAEE